MCCERDTERESVLPKWMGREERKKICVCLCVRERERGVISSMKKVKSKEIVIDGCVFLLPPFFLSPIFIQIRYQ